MLIQLDRPESGLCPRCGIETNVDSLLGVFAVDYYIVSTDLLSIGGYKAVQENAYVSFLLCLS